VRIRSWQVLLVAVAVVAAFAVYPAIGHGQSFDDDSARNVRTVDVSIAPEMQKITEALNTYSYEYWVDESVSTFIGSKKVAIGSGADAAVGEGEEGTVEIVSEFYLTGSINTAFTYFDSENGSQQSGCLEGYIVPLNETDFDVIFIINGTEVSYRDQIGEGAIDDCAWFSLAPLLAIPGINAIVAAVVVAFVVYAAYTYYSNNYVEYTQNVIDGISYKYKHGDLVSVTVDGTTYSINQLNSVNLNNMNNGKYYFAVLIKKVYIVPKAISFERAQKIMKLSNNPGGVMSTWTYSESNAKSVASVFGAPVWHDAHKPSSGSGYYKHYHTCGHKTNAHAFYYLPR
jgi:hypothetical protein